VSGAHPHSSVNVLLARLSSLLHRFRPDNGEPELPQLSRSLAFHIDALLARLSLLIHLSPPENDAPDLQQPPTPSRVDPRVLLARLSLFLHRSRLNTDEEAESHSTTPLNSRPDALITRLSSLFRSQPHPNEEIELAQRPSRPRVVDVAAVRDKRVCLSLVHSQSPWFNDFCSDFGCCSGANVYESIPSTSATIPIARPSSGVDIPYSVCRCFNVCDTPCSRNSSHTTTTYPMVDSHCAVSLLHISTRQWSLIQLVLQLPDNCFTYGSRDSALVSLSLCESSILFPCRETRVSNLIILIAAS
jgi:hypothetical protein